MLMSKSSYMIKYPVSAFKVVDISVVSLLFGPYTAVKISWAFEMRNEILKV